MYQEYKDLLSMYAVQDIKMANFRMVMISISAMKNLNHLFDGKGRKEGVLLKLLRPLVGLNQQPFS